MAKVQDQAVEMFGLSKGTGQHREMHCKPKSLMNINASSDHISCEIINQYYPSPPKPGSLAVLQ